MVIFCMTKNGVTKGRPRIFGKMVRLNLRLREGRSPEEDRLIERLEQLPKGQRSRYVRRVLTTGDVEPILDAELERETGRVASALDALATMWDDEET
jgi:hypothetical protein